MLVTNESVQEGAHAVHSTRSENGVLTPDTNGTTESHSNSRKRKIDELTDEPGTYDMFNEDFSVKVRFDPLSCHILRFNLTRCAGIPFVST